MNVYTQTITSGLVVTIPVEVTLGDFFIGGVIIFLTLLGLASVVLEVFW